jgi:hypothetical protein
MAKAYKWGKEQINGKWYIVCTSHEHMPMIEKTKDGKYAVKCLNGKLSKCDNFKDAEKLAIDIYKKFNKLYKKFESKIPL